jgi:hypothetical protein
MECRVSAGILVYVPVAMPELLPKEAAPQDPSSVVLNAYFFSNIE